MKIFLSSEIEDYDEKHADLWRKARNAVTAKIESLLRDADYGNAVSVLAIIPNIFTDDALNKFGYEEARELYFKKNKETDYRLRINHDVYMKAKTEEELRTLLLENIYECIRRLDVKIKKMGGDFKGEQLIVDIEALF